MWSNVFLHLTLHLFHSALGVLIPDVNDSTLSTSDLSSCLKYSTSCCLQLGIPSIFLNNLVLNILANLLPPRDSLPYTEKVYQVLFWRYLLIK